MAYLKVAIAGASGMLGSMVLDVLSRDPRLKIVATVRDWRMIGNLQRVYPEVDFRLLDSESSETNEIQESLRGVHWVINAIGKIKPYTHDGDPDEVERAIRVNALFPFKLAHVLAGEGTRIIQIATDCVFSGKEGHYAESAKHDALDVYGKSKSMGECPLPNVMHLRCSIIGPEPKAHVSLLDWFRNQAQGAQLNGYSNHFWNGVTTYHFARLCQGIIHDGQFAPHVQHVVPSGSISKADLLESFKREYKRQDISIMHAEVVPIVDRTLRTEQEQENRSLWKAAGYAKAPMIPEMVAEMAAHDFRMEGVLA